MKKNSALHADNQLLVKQVSLIAGRKLTTKISKQDHFTLCSSSFVLFHFVRPHKTPLYGKAGIVAMCRCGSIEARAILPPLYFA